MTDEINKNKTIDEGVIKRGGINKQSSTTRPSSPTGQGGNSNSQNSSSNKKESQ